MLNVSSLKSNVEGGRVYNMKHMKKNIHILVIVPSVISFRKTPAFSFLLTFKHIIKSL